MEEQPVVDTGPPESTPGAGETELRSAIEQQYRTLVDTAGDAIITIDENSAILSFNRAAEELFGWNADEVLGCPLPILMPERFRKAHLHGIRRYLATGTPNIPWRGVELPGLTRDGRELPLEISFGEYTVGGRRIFTGVLRDIGERLRQQKALEDSTVELEATIDELRVRTEQAESASLAKSEFLAAMSHELRTPLQAVIGFAALLRDEVPGSLNDTQKQQIGRIEASAAHLLGLIEQLLDIARAEASMLHLAPLPVDVCHEIGATIDLIEPLAAARQLPIEFEDCAGAALEGVILDATRLRQILLNLLSNAVKFTEQGYIRVRTDVADTARFRIQVIDTGIGMTEEQSAHVFQPFYQAESAAGRRTPGMGLGLAISHRLAEAMNGCLSVDSEPGRGSTFTLELPLLH